MNMTCSACDASHHLEWIDRLLAGRRTCDCDTCAIIKMDAENDMANTEEQEKEEA